MGNGILQALFQSTRLLGRFGWQLLVLVVSVVGLGLGASAAEYTVGKLALHSADACLLDSANCQALFGRPSGVARDPAGNLYVSDSLLHVVTAISPDGTMRVLAGLPGVAGFADGTGTNALLNNPQGLGVGLDGRVYVADAGNHCIRAISTNGDTVVFAGSPSEPAHHDGPAGEARFFRPVSLAVNNAGELLVADASTGRVRKVSANGAVITIYGHANPDGSGDYYEPPVGNWLQVPMALDKEGQLYFFNQDSKVLRKLATDGTILQSIDLSKRLAASWPRVYGLVVDSAGFVYAGGYVPGRSGAVGGIFRISSLGEIEVVAMDPSVPGVSFESLAIGPTDEIYAPSARHQAVVKLAPPVLPSVVRVITSDFIASGNTLRLEGIAIGLSPMTYRWEKDGAPVLGGTNSLLEVFQVTTDDSGAYQLKVSNLGGSAASTSRAVRVYDAAPIIAAQPTNASIIPGSNFVFSVSARGSVPLWYQWFRSGVPLPDQINNTLILSTPSAEDQALYTVNVSNRFGTISSEAAKVFPPGLLIRSTPAAGQMGFGRPFGISERIVGTEATGLGFLWTLNGQPITNGVVYSQSSVSTLWQPPFSRQSSGEYQLTVTNGSGTVVASTPVQVDPAVSYVFKTVAGQPAAGSADGPVRIGKLNSPQGIVYTSHGLFVADTANNTIRRVSRDGRLETFAGFTGMAGNIDGIGRTARFNGPTGLIADGDGNLFVADSGNHSIRRIDSGGRVATVISWPAVDPARTYADGPIGLVLESGGGFLVIDRANVIRRVSKEGGVSIFAGKIGESASLDGDLETARFDRLTGIQIDNKGDIFIADGTLRKIGPDGIVTTVGGTNAIKAVGVSVDSDGQVFVSTGAVIGRISTESQLILLAGDEQSGVASYTNRWWRVARDGKGAEARIFASAICGDGRGNLFTLDGNSVRVVSQDGSVSTLCGKNNDFLWKTGSKGSRGLLALGNGYLYSANPEEATVSRIAPDGTEQILAGRPFQPGTQDGDRQTARFISPVSVALDGHGNLLVADAGTLSVRRITPEGVVTTLAGGGSTSGGFADGTGTEAGFGSVGALAVDRDDIIYVTDPLNQALRKVTSAGVVSTITTNIICAGVSAVPTGGVVTFDESASTLLWITGDGTTTTTVGLTDKISGAIGGIAVGVDGVVFLSDYPGHTLWKATSSGANSLYAGETDVQGTRDGSVNAARFYLPGSLSIDPQGNLYVADSRGLVVRRIDPTGLVETLGVASRSLDGPADIADLVAPQGVVVDSRGNLFVTETSLNTIRKINPDGAIITWAGMPGVDGYADGLGSYARFSGPMDLAIDQYDNLYVTDVGNLAIRKIAPDGTVTTLAGPVAGFHTTDPTSPSMRVPARHGIAVDLDGNVYFNDSTGAIRKICADGKIRVFAGEDRNFYSVGVGEGAPEYSLTIGPDALRALAVDTVGNIYAAGNQGSQIYKMVTGLPPERLIPFDTIGEGALNSGGFNNASGIAVDRLGNVFLSQRSRAALCKIDVRGWLSTIAGNYEGLDIANASGGFTSLAMGKAGELYVSDAGGRSVIKGVPLTVGGPKLEIYRSGDTIVASWLMDRKDYQVESSDSPQGESEWTPVTEGITESVNRFFLTAVATQTTRYYRLRQRP